MERNYMKKGQEQKYSFNIALSDIEGAIHAMQLIAAELQEE